VIFFVTPLFAFSQTLIFDSLMQSGKAEFQKEFGKQDYKHALSCFSKAVELQPANAEAHYFLGYVYSRMNSADGNGMIHMKGSTTLKCSAQFEIVNRLTPRYEGEVVSLDPWSKLTAEWGSMAYCYLYRQQKDSALWAFNEGRKRGGFDDFFLAVNRKVLDFCDKNAILITSGDNFTIPLWYLQTVENYRTDVTVIDVSLINALWYTRFISSTSKIAFTSKNQNSDSVSYCRWNDSLVSIKAPKHQSFSWMVKSSEYDGYLLRGDILLLNVIVKNRFKREVYFTKGFSEANQLSLTPHFQSLVLCDRVNWNNLPPVDYDDYVQKTESVIALLELLNQNSEQELMFVDNLRYEILARVTNDKNAGDFKHAKSLLQLMDQKIDIQKFPFRYEKLYKYYEYIKDALK
jgi:hypothetical protein